jgi:hypothetical protein
MTAIPSIDLRDAVTTVAVANTPVFLARRLRENSSLKLAYTTHGSAKIFAALEGISKKNLTDIEDVTEVYFYIVALSLDSDLSWLNRLKGFTFPYVKWTREIIEYLLSIVKSTTIKEMTAPSMIAAVSLEKITTSNTNIIVRRAQ